MDAARLRAAALLLAPALLGLVLGLAIMALARGTAPAAAPDPRAIADAALVAVRDQGRLTTLTARYVAVATSSENRLGLTARKTLILPGLVRYGIDLRRLRREHLTWDEATNTLDILLPPLEISGPEIDIAAAREHAEGGVLMALTDAEQELDAANLAQARQDLLDQARQPQPLRTAREAALRAVAAGFALPLRAAGIDATVAARFQDPAGRDEQVHIDRARRIEDVVKDRQAGERPPAEGTRQ